MPTSETRYAAATGPFLERVGGRLLAAVECRESVIGPREPEWDLVALVVLITATTGAVSAPVGV